jgi:hypothetical protein
MAGSLYPARKVRGLRKDPAHSGGVRLLDTLKGRFASSVLHMTIIFDSERPCT